MTCECPFCVAKKSSRISFSVVKPGLDSDHIAAKTFFANSDFMVGLGTRSQRRWVLQCAGRVSPAGSRSPRRPTPLDLRLRQPLSRAEWRLRDAPREAGAFEMRLGEAGAFEMRPSEVGAFEMRVAEAGAFEMRPAEVGAFEMRPR